jgi:hypothetical protein
LTMPINLFLKLFRCHKIKSVANQAA